MHAIAGMLYARASVTPKRVLRSLRTQKVLTTARQIARATPGAPRTARPSKCTISSVTRAWSGMTSTLKPQQRSTHVLEHAQTHHGIPLHTKDACNSTSDSARNSRAHHPTRPSKCTISSTVRAWSGTSTSTPTETLHMHASNTPTKASWDSFARKRCSQRQHLLDNARNSRGRATDRSPIQMHYLVR